MFCLTQKLLKKMTLLNRYVINGHVQDIGVSCYMIKQKLMFWVKTFCWGVRAGTQNVKFCFIDSGSERTIMPFM